MSKPIAVCISDIHFNVGNLELATQALKSAFDKAEELDIPLVIAGDLHDTKAIIRAEVANRLLEIFKYYLIKGVESFVLIGNHDLINEKGKEHSLNFLSPYASIIDFIWSPLYKGFSFIPYQSDPSAISQIITQLPKDKPVIMHQGFSGAAMGDYIQDKSSLDPNIFKDFKVISGHYHRHQTIGPVTYIGSPFTHTFGEANDGSKGYLILSEDGNFERVILELRRHIILDIPFHDLTGWKLIAKLDRPKTDDLFWLKIRGTESELKQIDKTSLGHSMLKHSNYRLDLIPTDSDKPKRLDMEKLTNHEILDLLIDSMSETDTQKINLKRIYNAILNR